MNIPDDKNSELEMKILKALLPSPVSSAYSLTSLIKQKESNIRGINYPTINRHLTMLKNDGYVLVEKNKILRKDGQSDKRGNKSITLTFKGLFKLIIDYELNDSDVRLVIEKTYLRYFSKKTSLTKLPIIYNMPFDAFSDSIKEMRSRINLEHFDEEYAIGLFIENAIVQNVFKYFLKSMPEIIALRDKHKVKKSEARKTLRSIPEEYLRLLMTLYNCMKDERETLNSRIALLRPAVECLRSMGIKPWPIQDLNEINKEPSI